MTSPGWIPPWEGWKYGTVIRRREAPGVIAMVVARLDPTHMAMTMLADPDQVMVPNVYRPGAVFAWAAGWGGWEVVDDT